MTIVRGYRAHERNARQLPPQVGRIALAVLGVVQDGVDVVEDVPLADGGIVVAGAELFERPVGDVLASVGAVFRVGVEREALGRPSPEMNARYVSHKLRGEANL